MMSISPTIRFSLDPSSGYGLLLQNNSDPDVAFFSNINASNNVISNAPGQAFQVLSFDHFTLDDNIITGTAQTVIGSPYDDIILGSNLANVLSGEGGADTFVFDLAAIHSWLVDHILDYNQGNSGIFNSAEGDAFDFSALLRGQRTTGR